jgi:hypothetical protein
VIGKGLGWALGIISLLDFVLFSVKHLYLTPLIGIPGLDMWNWERRLIDPLLQEYRVLSFFWEIIPARFDWQHLSFWVLCIGFFLIGALIFDRARRLGTLTSRTREAIRVEQWTRPYARPRGGIETTIDVGAWSTLPESRWERVMRAFEGILIEVISWSYPTTNRAS